MKARAGLLVLLAGLVVFALNLVGCNGDSPTATDPHAPVFDATMSPTVADGPQIGTVTLRWSCSDPDGDPLTYTVFFGLDHSARAIADNVAHDSIAIRIPGGGTSYIWWVVATDSTGRQSFSHRQRFTSIDGYVYPLDSTHPWNYKGRLVMDNFSFDPVPSNLLDTLELWSVVYSNPLTYIDLPEPTPAYPLIEYNLWNEQQGPSIIWVNNTPEGMFEYAYEGGSSQMQPLKIASGTPRYAIGPWQSGSMLGLFEAVRFGQPPQGAQIGDSFQIENPPRKVLAYPLEVGAEWMAVDYDNLRIDKKVTDEVEITVPAGTFTAYEVEWTYTLRPMMLGPGPGGDGGTYFQNPDDILPEPSMKVVEYIGDPGLLQRTYYIHGITYTGYTPEIIGTYGARMEWWLESIGANNPSGTD